MYSQYNGSFCASDTIWTDDMKDQVPYSEDDGLFFVDIDTFIDAFKRFTISYYRDDWIMTYL